MFTARSQSDAFTQAAPLSAIEVEAQARRLRAETVSALAKKALPVLKSLVARYQAWQKHQQAVAELRGLDDAMLRDIGLNRSEIEAAVDGKMYRPLAQKVSQTGASNENGQQKAAGVVRLVPRQAA